MLSLSDLWMTAVASLLASGHCIGMCGGLVGAFSLRCGSGYAITSTPPNLSLPILLYNLGRVGVYTAFGALSGWAGSITFFAPGMARFGGIAFMLTGVVMVFMGLEILGIVRFVGLGNIQGGGVVGRLTAHLLRGGGIWRTLPLGILTGLLPCSLHWAFQAKAITSGSAMNGSLLMLFFGLGTLPALLAFSFLTHWLGQRARRWLLMGTAGIIVLMGMLSIQHGVNMVG